MNSLYNSLMGNNNIGINQNPQNNIGQNNMSVVKSIVGMLSGSANPYQVLTGIAAKNPMIKNVMDSANSSGKSYKDIFYELAKQKGVDPNSIISQLKS